MPDHFYVYPAYVTRSASRALGRRVPQGAAVAEATIEEIVTAAVHLGFQAAAEPDKQYPRDVPTYRGRVKVTKREGVRKTEFLRRVAAELARRKAAEGAA